MRKKLINILFILSSIALSGCSKNTTVDKRIYLSTKYELKYVASFENENNAQYPFFTKIKHKNEYANEFDLKNSFVDMSVKIENGKPVGYCSYLIILSRLAITYCGEFNYYCLYSPLYGEEIIIENNKPDNFKNLYYRDTAWWLRIKLIIPELTNDNIFLEFEKLEIHDYPPEFNHNIY